MTSQNNYWRRWVWPWKKNTAHLTLTEKGAYRELLCWSYANEAPLPLTHESLYRIAGAHSDDECMAVDKVIAEFFVRGAKGYTREDNDTAPS